MAAVLKILSTVIFSGFLFWIVLANRENVSVSLYPIWTEFTVPFGVVIFLSVLFGFLWGSLIIWFNGADMRSDYRKKKRELKKISGSTDLAS